MKRIFFALAACLPFALFTACDPAEQQGGDGAATECTYYLSVDQTDVVTIASGESKTFSLNVKAEETVGVEAVLTMTLAGNPDLVEAYNTANSTEYKALPTNCFAFDKAEVKMNRYAVSSTTATLTVTANQLEGETVYVLPVVISKVEGGAYKLAEKHECYILIERAAKTSVDAYDAAAQIAKMVDDPCEYAPSTKTPDLVIKTADDMMKIPTIVEAGKTKYVVLDADVDMAGKEWVPFNLESPYDKGLEFNGQGHTIKNFTCTTGSYRSFYGIMHGRMYNVTFENATIDGTNTSDGNAGTQPCAVIAGYAGNKAGSGTQAYIYDVNVTGTITGKAGGCGGLVGVAVNCIVKRCSVDMTINNTTGRRCGGLVGYHNVGLEGQFLRIEDSYSKGKIIGSQQVGGILGQTQYDNGKNGLPVGASLVKNCYSTMTIEAQRNGGGIAGSCAYGGTYADLQLDIPKDVVFGCIAWNDKITVTSTGTGNYSSGAVVGYGNIYQYFVDNYRKADLDFSCPVTGEGVEPFNITLIDQENSGDLITLKKVGTEDTACPYPYVHAYPYHGKAASASATVSSLAKQLKWDETVWDLSGSFPVLK